MKLRDHNKYFDFDNERKTNMSFCVVYIVAVIKNFVYKFFLLGASKRERKDAKYNVTICAIFKNEAPFLREWIVYHQLIGFDHFYLYNNFSEDNYLEVLTPFIKDGSVSLIEWPVPQGQMSSYKDWYENYRTETKWNIFLDLDEFICPRYETNIYKWLQRYAKYPVVEAFWKMFGTSGKLKHDSEKLVIEQYTVGFERLDNIGKIFYNTCFDISAFSRGMMHKFNCNVKRFGLTLRVPPVNEFGFFRILEINFVRKDYSIQINHYWSKAYDAYLAKHRRGDAVFEQSPRDFEYFLCHENKNRSTDYSIYRFLIQLKRKLG